MAANEVAESNRQSVRKAALILVAVLGTPACASDAGGTAESLGASERISSDGILECAQRAGSTSTKNSWYSVPAMDAKLRHFPEFARTTGLGAVATCSDARRFMQKYRDYREAHPNFDLDQPYEDVRLPTPTPAPITEEDLRAAQGTSPKIRNGTGDRLSPVVRVTRYRTISNPDFFQCTGTFIGRNWIMTAAHCLQTAEGWQDTDGTAAAKLHGWYKYFVEYYGPGGQQARIANYTQVLQYMDPRFVGFEPEQAYAAFDFALLYVHKDFDGMLPNLDPSLSLSGFPVMRVSTADHLVDGANAYFWGVGKIDEGVDPQPPDAILRKGSLAPYLPTFGLKPEPDEFPALRPVPGRLFYADVPSASVAQTCRGDSGGPIVERWDIKDANGVPVPQYVATAVLSHASGAPDCSDPGETNGWAPTYEERPFIQAKVSEYYPHFRCKTGTRDLGTEQYLECWGKPCQSDNACVKDQEYCHRPGKELKTCTGCADGGCGCIYGQCMPLPKK